MTPQRRRPWRSARCDLPAKSADPKTWSDQDAKKRGFPGVRILRAWSIGNRFLFDQGGRRYGVTLVDELGVRVSIRRVGIYVRVSTSGQTVENQRLELEAVAARHGWAVTAVYADEGISGAKGRDRRPAYDRLLRAIACKGVDVVAAWSVDRLGRSMLELLQFLGELRSKNVDLYLHTQGIDTGTPGGKALFGMFSVFADFERELMAERIRAGIARAKNEGKKIGRPRVEQEREAEVIAALERGLSANQAAKIAHVGISTARRINFERLERERSGR